MNPAMPLASTTADRNRSGPQVLGRLWRRQLMVALFLAAAMVAVLLPISVADAVVAPGDPIENLTATANGTSGQQGGVELSDDGNLATFRSDATNLTADPDNGVRDVFLIDRSAGTTINITANGNGDSGTARISADGSTVVFVSRATNLTADIDTGNDDDIFSYDVASGAITRITPDTVSMVNLNRMNVSGDGSTIVFVNFAQLAGTPTGFVMAYIWQAGTFTQMTEGISGNAYFSTISADGTVAFFSVFAAGAQQLYSWDVATSTASYITPGGFASSSNDGTMVAVYVPNSNGQLAIMDRTNPAAPTYTNVPGETYSYMISGDGQHVILTQADPAFNPRLFHYDITTAALTPLLPGAIDVNEVGINVDGSVVGFTSFDPSVTIDPDNGVGDVYVMFETAATCAGMAVTVDLNNGQSPTSGDDVILGTPGADVIDGLGGNDVICGEDGDDTIDGGDGDDTIYGADGDDRLNGGNGDDELSGWDGTDTLNGGPGMDEMRGGEGNDTLNGGPDNDELRGFTGDDVLHGDDGDDVVYGGFGRDVIRGGDGLDRLFGQQDDDRLWGDVGDDLLYGGSGNDTAHGGPGADRLWGQTGDDRLNGSAGNDWALGNAGDDILNGGTGDDVMYGSTGDDTIDGGDGADELYGQGGVDNMSGGPGIDSMYGGPGADFVFGDDGDDLLWGQAGNDNIGGGLGDDEVRAGTGVDNISGGDGADYLAGGDHRDIITGGPGNDELVGGDGNDDLRGGDGDDLLRGQLDNDDMFGEAGTDVCNGGLGSGDYAHGTCETTVAVP